MKYFKYTFFVFRTRLVYTTVIYYIVRLLYSRIRERRKISRFINKNFVLPNVKMKTVEHVCVCVCKVFRTKGICKLFARFALNIVNEFTGLVKTWFTFEYYSWNVYSRVLNIFFFFISGTIWKTQFERKRWSVVFAAGKRVFR